MKKTIGLGLLFTLLSSAVFSQTADPYMWLEDVDSERSMEFVNQHNTGSVDVLNKLPTYQPIYDKCLEIYNSTDRIVYPTTYGDFIYNFWQDKEHVRGIWRRSPKADYIAGNPKWEILMDIDAMSEADGVKWVYKGAAGLYPKYDRFLVSLSNGGGDAVVIKEFDVNKKAFVENGFTVEEAKGGVSYIDENTVIISTDFGPGSMTTSGYPSQAKVWKRGTALKDATLIYTGDINDVGAWGGVMRDGAKAYTIISLAITFYTSETYLCMDNKAVKLELPEDAESNGFINNQYIIALKSDWTVRGVTYKQGDLISLDFTELLKGVYQIQLIYRPDEFSSISGVSATKNKLLLELISNVNGELYVYTFSQNVWTKEKVKAPEYGKISVVDADEFSDKYYFNFANFLTPTTLYYADAASGDVKAIKSLPAYFDGSKFKVEQFKATSSVGTLVPYFIVSSKTAANNGHNPTLLYAYGGFESSSLPFYSGTVGTAWLERGGVYVLANIRGGGEYGPKWHQAGLKEKRQNVYNDFHAVAEDLIKRKITAPEHLGIMGGSNGGLLMGVAFTQRPDLYKAVVCQVPLLDMERYNKLLAGASWMGEYGNPDIPEEWAFIKKYSPYHNLKENAAYPEVFFTTSTRDDRVHPGHARKMVAKMESMGYKVYYYENIEGGHAGASTNEQRAKSAALEYSYLWMKLKH
jgi:prolyl oligopeptidase